MSLLEPIRLTRRDAERLAGMSESLAAQSRGLQRQMRILEGLMASALLLEAGGTPPGVVTLESRVLVEDPCSGEAEEIELVFPEEADPARGKLSVLSAVGSALLGRAVGEQVVAETEQGCRQLRIAALIHQPQAALS
ncbi:MAG TPA: GreA/GreB family elongation factor [Candidatus Desulfobacillus sp.]|nr:GreA/GreB family elongation factor [Candidatus Desulfobacillus sp.]